jgi:hypothetical protein
MKGHGYDGRVAGCHRKAAGAVQKLEAGKQNHESPTGSITPKINFPNASAIGTDNFRGAGNILSMNGVQPAWNLSIN